MRAVAALSQPGAPAPVPDMPPTPVTQRRSPNAGRLTPSWRTAAAATWMLGGAACALWLGAPGAGVRSLTELSTAALRLTGVRAAPAHTQAAGPVGDALVAPDFTLGLRPARVRVARTGSATVRLHSTGILGLEGNAAVRVIPVGAQLPGVHIAAPALTRLGTTSRIRLATAGAATGTFALEVILTRGSVTHTARATVVISQNQETRG
jgi:hypothetical protein